MSVYFVLTVSQPRPKEILLVLYSWTTLSSNVVSSSVQTKFFVFEGVSVSLSMLSKSSATEYPMAKDKLFLKIINQYFDFLAGFRPQQQDAFLQTLQ